MDVNKTDVKDVGNINPLTSKPISDVKDYASSYGAAAITAASKGITDMIEGIPKLTDTLFTMKAKQEGEEFGQAMYNAYTSKLENISKLPGNQQPSITNAEDGPTVPGGLIQGGDALAQASTALEYTKPGTPLQTLYLAQITKGAKELNDRWGGAAGYGDVVEHQIEKATGWNPNKYVQQLISGINQNAVQAQKEPNQVFNFLKPMMEKGLSEPGGDPQTKMYASDALKKYNEGKWSAQQVYDWGNRVAAVDADLTRRKSAAELDKTERGMIHEVYEGIATRDIAIMVHKDIDKMALDMGLVRTGKDLENWTNNILVKGKEALADPTQAINVQQALMARMNMIKSLAAQKANEPQFFMPGADRSNPDLRMSYIQMLGPGGATKWNTIVKEQTDYLQNLINALAKGDTAIADTAARKSQIVVDGRIDNFLTGPGGKFWSDVAASNRLGGPNFAERFFQQELTKEYGPTWVTDMIKDANFGFVHQRAWTLGEQSSPDTVKWAVDRAAAAGVKSPAAFKDLVKSVNQIVDSKNTDDIKANQIYASFHPNNYGLVSKFKQQGDVFALMTTPEITKEIYRLGKKDPRLWDMYDGWFKNSFSEVAGPSLREINKQADTPWLHLGYDTKEMKFSVKPDRAEFNKYVNPGVSSTANPGQDPSMRVPTNPYVSPDLIISQAQEAVDKMNKAMVGFKTFAETSGSDVNSYLYGVLRGLGLEKNSIADKFRGAVNTGIKAETQPPQSASQSPTNAPTSRKTVEPTPSSLPEYKTLEEAAADWKAGKLGSDEVNINGKRMRLYKNPANEPAPFGENPSSTIMHFSQPSSPAPTVQDFLRNPDLYTIVPNIPRAKVQSSAKVIGDDEAVAKGLYEPEKKKK